MDEHKCTFWTNSSHEKLFESVIQGTTILEQTMQVETDWIFQFSTSHAVDDKI